MNNCISKKDTKAVYKDGNTVRKVFAPDYSKTDVLYEALNTARVEDTGLDIPKILSVSVICKRGNADTINQGTP